MSFLDQVAFGLLDISARINPEIAAHHVIDFTQAQIAFWRPERGIIRSARTHTILTQAAERGARYAYIQATGHLTLDRRIFGLLEEFAGEFRFLVVGHIMDHKRDWFGLHHQCMFVDLDTWVRLGSPDLTQVPSDESFTHPERSPENIHDDYTPLWLRPSDTSRHWSEGSVRLRFGANFIRESINAGIPVHNFTPEMRRSKVNLYPDVPDTYFDTVDQMHRMQAGGRNMVYLYNTDDYGMDSKLGPLDTLVVPAAGFVANYRLAANGFHENTRVIHYDYSAPALEFRKHLIRDHWSGTIYPAEIEGLLSGAPWLVPMPLDWERNGRQHWAQHLQRLGGFDQWREHWARFRQLDHVFVRADITGSSRVDVMNQILRGKTLFDCSNIWTTPQTFFLRGFEHVGTSWERFIEALKNAPAEVHLVGHTPRWKFIDHQNVRGPGLSL